MIERLLLVAWKGSQSVGWAETFRASGYTVLVEETTGERAWRTAKERGIECIVIDGDKKPSLGRQTGYQMRDTAKTREIPIVWANLNPEEASLVQADVRPDVTLPRPTDAAEVLAAIESLALEREAQRLVAEPPAAPSSGVPAEPVRSTEVTESAAAKKSPNPVVAKRSSRAPAKAKKTAPAKAKVTKAAAGKPRRVVAAKVARKSPTNGSRRPSR
jgi:hypothetical protein